MNPFTCFTPTKIIFAPGAENQSGTLLKEYSCKKILLLYGGGSVVRSGLLDRVKFSIMQAGIEFVQLGGVVPNPLLSKVYEGIELAKKEQVDFILAVGGGSVVDSAKAIALGMGYEGDVWDFFENKLQPRTACPLACVLTLAATGSEMSDATVITKDEGLLKRSTHSDLCICKFALMDPALTLTLPDYQTASGCVDILMHTLERYLSGGGNLDITDRLSEALLVSVMENALRLKKNPQDLEARWNVMWAGSLSHNGLTGCGTNGGDWASHNIEHELGGMFDVTHGAGLAAVWGSWARYVLPVIPQRLAKLAVHVLHATPGADDTETALRGITAMEDFFRALNMPVSLKELGLSVTDAQIDELAEKATLYGKRTVGTVLPLKKQDIIKIFQAAR